MERETMKIVTCFCPKCHVETFEVLTTGGGKYLNPDIGTIYWFEGDGKCNECGYEGHYSDSSA